MTINDTIHSFFCVIDMIECDFVTLHLKQNETAFPKYMDCVACAIKLDCEVKKNLTQKTPSQMDVAPWRLEVDEWM